MDKDAELRILEKVLGGAARRAISAEAPDFTLKTAGGVIGFEVTEFYPSDVDAKLDNVAGYTRNLLDGTGEVHRRDRGKVDVCWLSIQKQDGTEVAVERAIRRERPPISALVSKLMETVEGKEQKHSSYVSHCDFVDLVIYDPGAHFINAQANANATDELPQFCYALPFDPLRRSPFREVFLVTRTFHEGDFVVPLKTMVLASDIHALADLMDVPEQVGDTPGVDDIQPLLLAYLAQLGHATVILEDRVDDLLTLMGGAWELNYAQDSTYFRDWTVPHRAYHGRSLAEVVNGLPDATVREARDIAARRPTVLVCVPICLPAFTPGQPRKRSMP
ncbi:hypothetical protein KCV01_g1159, partial [Aureobasidium melanogenum]